MRAFWRGTPLSADELELVAELSRAHFLATFRDNISTVVLKYTAVGTGDYYRSISAALGSMGGKHAPIEEIHDYLSTGVQHGEKTPGWGSSFVKGEDPNFIRVRELLAKLRPDLIAHIDYTTSLLEGKAHPNPGCWTAATAIALGIPAKLSPYLIVACRLDAWSIIFNDLTKQGEQ